MNDYPIKQKPYLHLFREDDDSAQESNWYLFYSVRVDENYIYLGIDSMDTGRTTQVTPGFTPITMKIRKRGAGDPVGDDILSNEILLAEEIPFGSSPFGHKGVDFHVVDANDTNPATKRKGKTVVVYEHADDDSSSG